MTRGQDLRRSVLTLSPVLKSRWRLGCVRSAGDTAETHAHSDDTETHREVATPTVRDTKGQQRCVQEALHP